MSEQGGVGPGPLFRTTIVIWSKYAGEKVELESLARDATSGDAYCSRYYSEQVREPREDPAWDGTEFFSD